MLGIKTFFVNRAVSFVCRILQQKETQQVIAKILSEETLHKAFWKSANVRPDTDDMFYAYIPNSVRQEVYRLATRESAEYVGQKMQHLGGISDPLDLLTHCINQVTVKGLFLEFGVFSGYTINHIASLAKQTTHGFDSFEGLPENWNAAPKGTFDVKGRLPPVAENVKLHVGWFDETLPRFKDEYTGDVAFLHIDSDLYSSAKTVLMTLKDQIIKGTIIVFDEYFNYPGWQLHEFLAFREFIEETGKQYEYIAFADKGFSVGVKIL